MNRREFLARTGTAAGAALLSGRWQAAAGALPGAPAGAGVVIIRDPVDAVASAPPVQWAVGRLQQVLQARGWSVRLGARPDEAGPAERCIVAAGRGSALARDAGIAVAAEPEALTIASARLGRRDVLGAMGSDSRGLVYALTELADAVALGADPAAVLRPAQSVSERPANRVRSVMRLFASDVEDKGWFNDRAFWSDYFALLVTQRFNRFNLALGLGYDQPVGLRDAYFYFAYPFLVAVPGYDVRATNLPDAERDRNLAQLCWISDAAAAHGLDFQLGLWTHAYEWTKSPAVNHVITGLTPATHAPYCRDALALVLRECPNITGVTIRIHGESGVPEGSYDLWRTIFDGGVRSGRRVGLDLHAKGMDQPTLDAAQATGLPLTISPKFWAEHLGLPYHQAAIRPTELPTGKAGRGPFAQSEGARSFLRYGYGDLLREDRRYAVVHRVWPGTQRLLLWGDPVFAAAYSRAFDFCGSDGCELMEPLSFKGRKGSGLPGGRDGYADVSLRAPGADFEKFRLTYRLWGRSLYNPATMPAVWERQLRADYGGAAPVAAAALAPASRILALFTTAHCPSAANNNYWPEMYVNMAIADPAAPVEPYSDTPLPRRFGTVSPLDPQLFARVEDFADELLLGGVGGKYTPVEVAQWMEDLAQTATAALATNDAAREPAFRRLAIDVRIQAGLGRFFAHKLRAAVLYALHERTGDGAALAAALKTYRTARQAWTEVAGITTGVYVNDVSYGEGWFQRGHWSDRLAAIDRDIAAMEQKSALATATVATEKVAPLLRQILGRPRRPAPGATHVPPASFRPGEPVGLVFTPAGALAPGRSIQLHYRHTHQAESWRTAIMEREGENHRAAIPGDYTAGNYPLEYYFEASEAPGAAWLYPGLGPDLTRQPYFLVRPALPA